MVLALSAALGVLRGLRAEGTAVAVRVTSGNAMPSTRVGDAAVLA